MTLICRRLPRVSLLAGNKILFVLNAASGTPVGQIVAFMCNEIPGSERGAILAAVFCMVEANAHGIRNLHDLYVQVSPDIDRSEEHTSELQSLMRISYAVFCLQKKNESKTINTKHHEKK